ncbi:MAG: DUF4910 domain-containing protein [Aurantibacter sp.]
MKPTGIGKKIYDLSADLFPICRSITGEGVRQTLGILREHISLEIHEVPSGTEVFDWKVPEEWNIKEAWIKDEKGNTIVDFKHHNLHILNYSIPIHEKISLDGLKKHLYTLPDQPSLIPYRTSYYEENWGFCLAHEQYQTLKEGTYEVFINASLEPGYLTYGEYFIPGKTKEEMLFSAHICHPSLANDNLSGICLLVYLAKYLRERENRYSYRFLFAPGTIGSITWLAINEAKTKHIKHGIVASLLGDGGAFTYKKSRRETAEIDQVAAYVLKNSELPYQLKDYIPYGYDERQFCSPGFNLPIGNLSRSQFGSFPEYHTSADNMSFIQPEYLDESYEVYRQIVKVLEANYRPLNLNPKCEPQLGKRGLYKALGGQNDQQSMQMAMLWVLNYSDGSRSLLEIAEKSAIPFEIVSKVGKILEDHQLLSSV